MPRYGYIRLDKKDPDVARQASQLDSIGGFDKIFVEQNKTGRAEGSAREQSDRVEVSSTEQLDRAMAVLREGDLLYVASLDRFCTKMKDFINHVDWILSKGADFVSLDESFDTRSASSKVAMRMIRKLELLERETMSNKKKEGIRAARNEGRRIGRPPVSIPTGFREICREWEQGRISGVEAILKSGMKSTSFYKKASELGFIRRK
jgi:DNA invertase Pin-like site-specific DNA recombinase